MGQVCQGWHWQLLTLHSEWAHVKKHVQKLDVGQTSNPSIACASCARIIERREFCCKKSTTSEHETETYKSQYVDVRGLHNPAMEINVWNMLDDDDWNLKNENCNSFKKHMFSTSQYLTLSFMPHVINVSPKLIKVTLQLMPHVG